MSDRTKSIVTHGRLVFFIAGVVVAIFSSDACADRTLTWEDCLREAQKNHPDLIVAQETVVQSLADREIAKSSLLPQVSVDAGVSTGRTATGHKTTRTYDAGVSATQKIFDAGKTASDVRSAGATIAASRAGYRFTSADVRWRLRTAFVILLKAQETIRVAQDILDLRRGNLVLISLRYQSGLEHKGALLTAEANAADAKAGLDKAERDHVVAERALTQVLGAVSTEPVKVEGGFDAERSEVVPDFDAIAKSHPSLQQATFEKNAARFGIDAARADFYPSISGDVNLGRTGRSLWPEGEHWDAGLALSWPVFEGGLKTATLDKARSLFKQSEAKERGTKDSVRVELEAAWTALKDAIDNVDVQKKFLEAAAERSKIAEAQYSLGLIIYDNWTVIQDGLVKAKMSLLDAQASALFAEADWVQAEGGTLENVT
jgi:outer membrane protein TolC